MKAEGYFNKFRKNIVGEGHSYPTPYGLKKMLYADWISSGRLYKPIEDWIVRSIGPFITNTHAETSENGRLMTEAYQLAHQKIKNHVNADPRDVIITTGFGMTGAVTKFQRLLGLKTCGEIRPLQCLQKSQRPVVFVTHMEHHSNHTSWYETTSDVVVIEPGDNLLVDLNRLEDALKKYKDRKWKIGSFTACSNVTGIRTPYHEMAALMHRYGGYAFIDFAASAPYDNINMHPQNPEENLDAIFFSPHKFLGGPGSSGVLVFNSSLYSRRAPDQPGGGTVKWTNPWGEYDFIDDIEIREDGGTPGFLQAFRTAFAIELKNRMGVENIHQREEELKDLAFAELGKVPDLRILADDVRERLAIFSFYMPSIHYNLIVKLLSDRFGIQVRGGCDCAGTYGHYLLNVSYNESKLITDKISNKDQSAKPGWVRLSFHPTTTDLELLFIADALKQIRKNYANWSSDYTYNKHTNEFIYKNGSEGFTKAESFFTMNDLV
jgi:selenocysteine lyase/cysteine desulfurase